MNNEEVWISKDLVDLYISHDKVVSVNVSKEYDDMRKVMEI